MAKSSTAAAPDRTLREARVAERQRREGQGLPQSRRSPDTQLSDILRAAHFHSQAGQQPQALQSRDSARCTRTVFDFSAMSKLVTRNVPKDELPAARRKRIEWALAVLRNQPFYPGPGGVPEVARTNSRSTTARLRWTRTAARLPQLVEVVKAIAIAELEARGGYVESDHDPFFERYDENALTAEDLAQFPDYLVCIPVDRNDAPRERRDDRDAVGRHAGQGAGAAHDLLEEGAIGQGRFSFGVRSARLATTAMGLGGMFVLQSTSSNLYACATASAAAWRAAGRRCSASSPVRPTTPANCRRT
jgi:hypothetical protein